MTRYKLIDCDGRVRLPEFDDSIDAENAARKHGVKDWEIWRIPGDKCVAWKTGNMSEAAYEI